MMIKRSTWVLLFIFLVLLVGYFVWQKEGPKITAKNNTPTPTQVEVEFLIDMPEDVYIKEVELASLEGDKLKFNREGNNVDWVLEEPSAGDFTDALSIDAAVRSLEYATVDMTMSDFDQLDAVGLQEPKYQITLTLSDGTTHEIAIGDETITHIQYYLRIDNSVPKVVLKSSFEGLINFLTNPPILPTLTPTMEATITPTSTPTPNE